VKKPAYWKEIAKECNVDNIEPNDDLTLQTVLNLGLANFREQIEDISKKAEKQWSLEKKLNTILDVLKNLKIDTLRYKNTGTYVLKGIDETQQVLDDQLNILLMMKSSPYIKPVLSRASATDAKIILIQDTLDGWIKTQRGWMYLEPIFSSDDIKEKMKN
jgi:dynein heavy chain